VCLPFVFQFVCVGYEFYLCWARLLVWMLASRLAAVRISKRFNWHAVKNCTRLDIRFFTSKSYRFDQIARQSIYLTLRGFAQDRDLGDLYKILGVSKTATQPEIKRAYFHEAKKHHPDMNPNDAGAKDRFQRLSAAYEILSDPKKRAEYDVRGNSWYKQSQTQSNQSQQSPQDADNHSRDTFNSVWKDFDIVKEAWSEYTEEVLEELNFSLKAADAGDFKPLWNMAVANRFVILGVVVPIVAVLRFPAAIGIAFRFVAPMATAVAYQLIRSGQAPLVAAYLWKKLISLAKRRRERTKKK
jgi:hypothetical protein